MEYTLSMTFLNEAGEKSNFSISLVKPDLTKDQVDTLMDTLIAKNIFFTSGGNLIKKSSAQLTQKQVTKFEVA